jgi:hypothetical protein
VKLLGEVQLSLAPEGYGCIHSYVYKSPVNTNEPHARLLSLASDLIDHCDTIQQVLRERICAQTSFRARRIIALQNCGRMLSLPSLCPCLKLLTEYDADSRQGA